MYGDPRRYKDLKNKINQTQFEDLDQVRAHFPNKNIISLLNASILSGIPFVLLSDQFEDKIIGKSFEPKLEDKGKKNPIYFLSHDSGNKMLLHKS